MYYSSTNYNNSNIRLVCLFTVKINNRRDINARINLGNSSIVYTVDVFKAFFKVQ